MREFHDPKAFSKWIDTARPGSLALYHEGFLMIDRSTVLGTLTINVQPVHDLARLAMVAQEQGRVDLVQTRIKDGVYHYIAIKRSQRT